MKEAYENLTDYQKQELVVEYLWQLVRDNQDTHNWPHNCRTVLNEDDSFETSANLTTIHTALERIMNTFGYDVMKVD